MKPILLLLGFAALLLTGCSNQSGTAGPETIPVELSVWVLQPLRGIAGATVFFANMKAVTPDTTGLVVFHTDINVLVPNHTYQIVVSAPGFVQAFPGADTVRIPSVPDDPYTGYHLVARVQMKPAQ